MFQTHQDLFLKRQFTGNVINQKKFFQNQNIVRPSLKTFALRKFKDSDVILFSGGVNSPGRKKSDKAEKV